MKLSKRLAAVVLVLSMLLTVMPVFAAEDGTANTRVGVNTKVTLPETGSVSISGAPFSLGTGNGCGVVISAENGEQIGLDKTDFAARVFTKGTAYEGMIMKGKMVLSSNTFNYNAKADADAVAKAKNSIMKNGYPVSFDFAVEITAIRLNGAGTAFVLEAPYADYIASATNVKVIDTAQVDFDELDAAGKVTDLSPYLVDFTDEFTSEMFNTTDGRNAVDITLERGDNFVAQKTYDLGFFPSDTKFFSMQAQNMYGDSFVADNYWQQTTLVGFNAYYRSGSQTSGNVAGPFAVATPNFSGEYKVYALKYGHVSSWKKARANVNGTVLEFNGYPGTGSSVTGWGAYWSPATDDQATVTLTKGTPVFISDTTLKDGEFGEGAVLALAFVPASETVDIATGTGTENTGNNVIDDITNAGAMEAFSAVDFTNLNVGTYSVTIEDYLDVGTDEDMTQTMLAAEPYYVRNRTATGGSAVDYFTTNVLGEATKYATVYDAVIQYLVSNKEQTVEDALAAIDNYQIYLNGVREYNYKNMVVQANDKITVKNETVTTDNFNPICLDDIASKEYYVSTETGDVRFGITVSKVTDKHPFLYTGTAGTTAGTYPTAKFSGYMTFTKDGDYTAYKGQKVYFDNLRANSKNNDIAGDKNRFFPNFTAYGVREFSTVSVTTPTGIAEVMNPNKVLDSNCGGAYDVSDLYWVNDTVTDEIRVQKIDNAYVLRCDAFAMIRVITVKADGSVSTARVELLPTKAYSVKPATGEKVFVWEDTPYNGSTMKPLCAVIGE